MTTKTIGRPGTASKVAATGLDGEVTKVIMDPEASETTAMRVVGEAAMKAMGRAGDAKATARAAEWGRSAGLWVAYPG
jgi:hypothetical protein